MKKRSALVVGASGLIGGYCLNELLNDNDYSHVKILVRQKLSIEHPKLTQHIIDFEQLASYSNLIKADNVFCCLGTTIKIAKSKAAFRKVDLEYPFEIAKIASSNLSNQFLMVSSLGANESSTVFYNRVKGEVESAIAKLHFSSLIIFRPSLLLGERNQLRIGEKIGGIIANALSFLLVGKLRKYRPIAAKKVARVMVWAGKQKNLTKKIVESDQISECYQLYCKVKN